MSAYIALLLYASHVIHLQVHAKPALQDELAVGTNYYKQSENDGSLERKVLDFGTFDYYLLARGASYLDKLAKSLEQHKINNVASSSLTDHDTNQSINSMTLHSELRKSNDTKSSHKVNKQINQTIDPTKEIELVTELANLMHELAHSMDVSPPGTNNIPDTPQPAKRRKRDLLSAVTPISPIVTVALAPILNPVTNAIKPTLDIVQPIASPILKPVASGALDKLESSSLTSKPLESVSSAISEPVKEVINIATKANSTFSNPVTDAIAGVGSILEKNSDTVTLGSGTLTGNVAAAVDNTIHESVKTLSDTINPKFYIEDPYQDISAYVKNKEGRNTVVDPAGLLKTKANVEHIYNHPSLDETRRFGSHHISLVDVTLVGGLTIIGDALAPTEGASTNVSKILGA